MYVFSMFLISGQSPDSSIRPEPSFVGTSLKNITVPEGRDVVLSCTVKNLDGHKVAWIHYDRSAILTVDKTVITRNARIGVSHESSRTWNLHIRDVQRSDAGAYMCQINTAKAKTRMGHLTVVGKFILILIHKISVANFMKTSQHWIKTTVSVKEELAGLIFTKKVQ